MEFEIENIPIQEVTLNFATDVRLFVKREDLIHPFVSGNKYRKLKFNLAEAKKQNQDTLLTFGGAFSNHIAAVAAAGKLHGFKTIGVIRGEELISKIDSNPTLKFAQQNGMQFHFISRQAYREKTSEACTTQLKQTFGRFYSIPEGGTNDLAVKGCAEIITENERDFDTICCAVGTGGTIAGICEGAHAHQQILGFPALKGDFLHQFKQQTNIPLDPIYTGKMLFGIIDLIKNGHFGKQNRILAIHSGGLQGIAGMNQKLQQKGQKTII